MLNYLNFLIIIFLSLFCGTNFVFSAETPLQRIQKLEEENQKLSEKYIEFSKATEQYVKILSEGRVISDEKEGAYDQALNNIKLWFWIIAGFLAIFGYNEWRGIKQKINIRIEKEFTEKINKKIQSKIDEEIAQEKNLLVKTTKELEDRVTELEEKYNKNDNQNEKKKGSSEENLDVRKN